MATEVTKPSYFDSLGLSKDKEKSLAKLRSLAQNDEFTVNKLGEVVKYLQTLDQSDRKSISGLDSKDLDKMFDYRAKRIMTLTQYEPGTIIGGKYYPGQQEKVAQQRAGVKADLTKQQAPYKAVANRGLLGEIGTRVVGLAKGATADQYAAELMRQGKKPDPAYYIPESDPAQQGAASFGYGLSQGMGSAIAGIPSQSVASGAVGLLGRGIQKFAGTSAPVNIALAATQFAAGAYGAQKGGELFNAYQDPFRGLPEESKKLAQQKGVMAFSGPEKTLGSVASQLSVFKPGYLEGAGLRATGRGIMRSFTGATQNPEMMATATDIYDRVGSMMSTNSEVDAENKKIEQTFLETNGRPGTRAELIGWGWKTKQDKLAQMAADALLGDHTFLGRAASGQAFFDGSGKPSMPKMGNTSPNAVAPQASAANAQTPSITGGVRPIRVLTTIPNATGSPIPHAIRYDASSGGAEVRPHAALPGVIIQKVNEGVKNLGTINGVSVTGVSDTGDIFLSRVDASGQTVIESKSFNELPPDWQTRIDNVFKASKDSNQRWLSATALPQAEYNPTVDADPAYKSAYKTPLVIDGVTVNAAVVSDKNQPLITVKLPSGVQLTLPRTSFADPDNIVQQTTPATVETSVSNIKTAGANKFNVGVTSNGADFLIPESHRANHAANPAHFRGFFSAPSRPSDVNAFKRGTVVSLGNFNGRDQVGVVLDYKEFDIDGTGTKGYGFQVKSVTDPSLKPFYVSGTDIKKASPAVTAAVTGGTAGASTPAPATSSTTPVPAPVPATTTAASSPVAPSVGMPGTPADLAALSGIPAPPSPASPTATPTTTAPTASTLPVAPTASGTSTTASTATSAPTPTVFTSGPSPFGGSTTATPATPAATPTPATPATPDLTTASGIPADPYRVAKQTAELVRNGTLDEWNALDKAQQSALIKTVLRSPDACNEIATDMLSSKSPSETAAWLPETEKEAGGETYIYNLSGRTPSDEALAFIEAAKTSFGKLFKPVHEDYNDFGDVFLEMYQDDIIFMTGRSGHDADGLVTGISPSIASLNNRSFYYTRGNKADSIQLGVPFKERPYDSPVTAVSSSPSALPSAPSATATPSTTPSTAIPPSSTTSLTPALSAAVESMNAPAPVPTPTPAPAPTPTPASTAPTESASSSKSIAETVDTEPPLTDLEKFTSLAIRAVDPVTSQPTITAAQLAEKMGRTLGEVRPIIQLFHDLDIIDNGDGETFPVIKSKNEALDLVDNYNQNVNATTTALSAPVSTTSAPEATNTTTEPVTSSAPTTPSAGQVQLVDDEGYAIPNSAAQVPPEQYGFPYDRYDVIPERGVLPQEMERGRADIERYRRITPNSEEGRAEPTAVTLKRLPAWARGESGFSKVVSNIRVKLFDSRTNVSADWNVTVSGVSNKEELIEVLKKEWGQTDEQARVLGEWVDRFSIGWAKEFARLHGIRTLDRYRALRIPGVDPEGFPKGQFDQWKTKYREQMVVSATKENAEVIMRLQKAFYTNRLGAIAALTGDQSKAIGRTGMTFSVQGDSKRLLSVIAAVHGPGNFNTHVHEINHALIRSMYAPMVHEMASRVYETYKQQYSADKKRQIMSALEEQIVTEMTNRLFNYADTPNQNLFGSEYFEGGFDASLNKLAMDMSNAMRASVPLSDNPANNLFENRHWMVAYDKDIDYAKGTPIIFMKDGKQQQGKFVNTLANGVRVSVGDTQFNVSSGEIKAIGSLDVTDLSKGAKSYMSKMFGHWYEYTGQVIDKLAPTMPISTESFNDITIAEVRRYTSGYKWWLTKDLAMSESPYTGLDVYGQRFSPNRVSERMSQSYLGWLDRGGYDAYITGNDIDIEGLDTAQQLTLSSRVVNGEVKGFNVDTFKQASEMILGTAPNADPDDPFGGIDTEIKPMGMPSPDDLVTESNNEDIRVANAKQEESAKETTITRTFDNTVERDVVNALKAKLDTGLAVDNERLKSKVVDSLLKQGFVSWVTNRKVLPKYRWVTGFEYARMGFVGPEFGGTSGAFRRKTFDEMFNYVIARSSGPSEIVTSVYTEVRNDLLKLMGNLHPMIDPVTKKVVEGQYAYTVVDADGFHSTTIIDSKQLMSRFHNAVSAGAERAVKMVADEIHPPTGETRTVEMDAKSIIESDPVLMSVYATKATNKMQEGMGNIIGAIHEHEAWANSGSGRTYTTLTLLYNKLVERGPISKPLADLLSAAARNKSMTQEQFVEFKNQIAWNADARQITEFALVGTKKTAYDTLRLIGGKVHVADLNAPAMESARNKILERESKREVVQQVRTVVSLDDAFNNASFDGNADWQERIGSSTFEDQILDIADSKDAVSSFKASQARQMLGMFDSSAFVKQIGMSDPSFDRDAYYAAKRTYAAYEAVLQKDKAEGKKTSDTVLKHANEAAGRLSDIEKQVNAGVPETVKAVETITKRLSALKKGKGEDASSNRYVQVNLDVYNIMRAIAIGDTDAVSKLSNTEAYKIIDEATASGGMGGLKAYTTLGIPDRTLRAMASAHDYVENATRNLQDNFSITPTYAEAQMGLTPIEMVVAERRRINFQARGIKPIFADGKKADVTEAMTRRQLRITTRLGDEKLNTAQAEVVRKFDQIEKGLLVTSLGKLPRIRQANVNQVITAVDTLIADAIAGEDADMKAYFTPKNNNMYTANEWRIHVLTEMFEHGPNDPKVKELVTRLGKLVGSGKDEMMDESVISDAVNVLFKSTVIPPSNIWTMRTVRDSVTGEKPAIVDNGTFREKAMSILTNARDEPISINHDDFKTYDQSVGTGRSLKTMYKAFVDRYGEQTMLSDDQLRILANVNNDGLTPVEKASLFIELQKQRNAYVKAPLESWLKNHSSGLSQMTVSDLNKYLVENDVSKADSFAIMHNIVSILSNSRSPLRDFTLAMGRLPSPAELPMIATQIFERSKNKKGETPLVLENVVNDIRNAYEKVHEEVASLGLQYLTNAVNATRIQQTAQNEFTASSGMYGLFLNAPPDSMDIDNGRMRHSLLEQSKMFGTILGEQAATSLRDDALADIPKANETAVAIVKETERLNASRVRDVIFETFAGKPSKLVPAPGSKQAKTSKKTESPEQQFVEYVKKQATAGLIQMFDAISAGDGFDPSIAGMTGKQIKSIIHSPSQFSDPTNLPLVSEMKRFTEALAKDMIKARYELVKAINDPTLNNNQYIQDPNNATRVFVYDRITGQPTHLIDYATADVYPYDPATKEFSPKKEFAGGLRQLTEGQKELYAGIVRLSPNMTSDAKKRVQQAVMMSSSLETVPAVYWHGKSRIENKSTFFTSPDPKAKVIEPMFMNEPLEDVMQIDSKVGTRDPQTIDKYVKPVVMKWVQPDKDGFQRVQLGQDGLPTWDGYGYTVQTPTGSRSHTYANLVATGLSRDKALEVYALTEHPEFTAWKAGDLVDSVHLNDAGSFMAQGRKIAPETAQKVRGILQAEQLKRSIDEYMDNRTQEAYDMLKFHYDELFGAHLTDDELNAKVEALAKDDVQLMAVSTLADQYAAPMMTPETGYWVNPVKAHMEGQTKVSTGRPFTTMAFDFPNSTILSYQAPGFRSHDLASGLHKNNNRTGSPRFIKMENPLVFDAGDTGLSEEQIKNAFAKAMKEKRDGVVFTNYSDSLLDPNKKNIAFTFNDANIKFVHDMHTPITGKSVVATQKTISPMFMNDVLDAPMTKTEAPPLLLGDLQETQRGPLDYGRMAGEYVLDELQAITRAPLSLDLAFTAIQGGKYLLGAFRGRPMDTYNAIKALIYSFPGLAPNLQIEIFGRKIGFGKLGRRLYMKAYQNMQQDPDWQLMKDLKAPLHMLNLERRFEAERDRIYRESNGAIAYEDININLMDYDERGNLPDFFQRNTLVSQLPLQGMFERQISLQHDMLMFFVIKHQLHQNPILANAPRETLAQRKDAQALVNFVALTLGDFQYSTDERRDAIAGRVGKFVAVAPRWFLANVFANSLGNMAISNSKTLRKLMGTDNRVFDVYSQDVRQQNPELVKYMNNTTWGTMGVIGGFQLAWELLGWLTGREDINSTKDKIGSIRAGNWKWSDSSGSWDMLNTLDANWNQLIGGDPGVDQRGQVEGSGREKAIEGILNRLGYKAAPIITAPLKALYGRDVINRNVWETDTGLDQAYRERLQPLLKANGFNAPKNMPLARMWWSNVPSSWQEYTEAYSQARKYGQNSDVAAQIALTQFVAAAMGTRAKYSPFIPSKNMKLERYRATLDRKRNQPVTMSILQENMKFNKEENLPWYKRTWVTGSPRQ